MSLPHTPRLVFLILLPITTGLGLFTLAYLYPVTWQPKPHRLWGWIFCGLGLLIIIIPITGLCLLSIDTRRASRNPILELMMNSWDDRPALALFCLGGSLVFVIGWAFESILQLLSYIISGFLYMSGLSLFGFGAWQAVSTQYDDARRGRDQARTEAYDEGYTAGRAKGFVEGYSTGRSRGYTEGSLKAHAEGQERRYNEGYEAGHARGLAEGRAENAVRERKGSKSFDPWLVLGLPPGSTQEEIRKGYRDQMGLYHPERSPISAKIYGKPRNA